MTDDRDATDVHLRLLAEAAEDAIERADGFRRFVSGISGYSPEMRRSPGLFQGGARTERDGWRGR